jgi:small subunit ribosomal protein S7
MSRRRKVYKKEEKLDSRYGSVAVARLISTVMKRGKKSLAERIVYTAIDKSREGSDAVDPLEVVNKALMICAWSSCSSRGETDFTLP